MKKEESKQFIRWCIALRCMRKSTLRTSQDDSD